MDTSDAEQTTIWGAVGRPPEEVQRLYDDGYGIHRLAQIFDCSTTEIIDDLLELDLVALHDLYPDRLPQLVTAEYERVKHGPHRVRVHRLLMVAEEGFEAVANAVEIHHESCRWDNRPDELVLCATRQEHQDLHNEDDTAPDDLHQLSEFRDGENHSLAEFTQARGVPETSTS